MKNIDLTKPVMSKVVRFEKSRIRWWSVKFIATFGILSLLLGGALWVVYRSVTERQTLELFTLLAQDWEIIQDYWQDTLVVAWQELPQRMIISAGILLLGIVMVWFLTRKKRQRIKTIQHQLAKYRKHVSH